MNHWFLVGRDIMWAVLSLLPLLLSFFGGMIVEKERYKCDFFIFWIALIIQISGIAALYYGDIR